MQLHRLLCCLSVALSQLTLLVQAHDLSGADDHPHYDWSVRPPERIITTTQNDQILQMAQAERPAQPARFQMPITALPFRIFRDRVKLHWDDSFLYVESNGLPKHSMMVGITAWQQQVPAPQNYFGSNSWTIPLHPCPSNNPVSIKGRFLRGAIALAANGIPIFNPQNNRGEISQEIGELDQWGGHCGRADDYHYHAAPLHLQAIVGQGQPIAYALDGYAIYGLTEPDGSKPVGLDPFDGHSSPDLGYHYHASKKYPFVNGGFHGQVTEREGQVDPQPQARPIRPALPPLRGATVTGYTASPDGKICSLRYKLDGKTNSVNYSEVSAGVWKFQYVSSDGTKTEDTYRAGDRSQPEDRQSTRLPGESRRSVAPVNHTKSDSFTLRSSVVLDGTELPQEFTGDGKGLSPPLEWDGVPQGSKSFAISMFHIDREGRTKWYWTLYNIPANIHALQQNVQGVGTFGSNSINRELAYAPPHSKGPGPKTYTITLFALSSPLHIDLPPSQVTRDVLLSAMKGKVLASSELHVVSTHTAQSGEHSSMAR